jgi:hypothetical protein
MLFASNSNPSKPVLSAMGMDNFDFLFALFSFNSKKLEKIERRFEHIYLMFLNICGHSANDVAMLQAAHVGIGLPGEEGRQAVMASDFQIGRFSLLRRLLVCRLI